MLIFSHIGNTRVYTNHMFQNARLVLSLVGAFDARKRRLFLAFVFLVAPQRSRHLVASATGGTLESTWKTGPLVRGAMTADKTMTTSAYWPCARWDSICNGFGGRIDDTPASGSFRTRRLSDALNYTRFCTTACTAGKRTVHLKRQESIQFFLVTLYWKLSSRSEQDLPRTHTI